MPAALRIRNEIGEIDELPGHEPVTPKYKKRGGTAPPSEDDAGTGLGEAKRYLRLGNMLLLRNRLRPASVEHEKGQRLAGGSHWLFAVKTASWRLRRPVLHLAGGSHWLFAVKLGRTYLALGEPAEAGKVVAAAASTHPEPPWPHLIADGAALAQGDARGAAEWLLRAVAINPTTRPCPAAWPRRTSGSPTFPPRNAPAPSATAMS